jgi:hypothetical protein
VNRVSKAARGGLGRFEADLGPFCGQKSQKIAKNRGRFWAIFVDAKGVIVIFRVSKCIKSPPLPAAGFAVVQTAVSTEAVVPAMEELLHL